MLTAGSMFCLTSPSSLQEALLSCQDQFLSQKVQKLNSGLIRIS